MLEENALVVAADEKFVWVEIQKQTACGQCVANKGCGNALLENLFGKRSKLIRVESDVMVKVGDEVVLGINESALLKGSVIVYVLPLVAMIVFAMLGETFASHWLSMGSDKFSMLGALIGLVVSIVGLRWFSKISRNKTDYQPVILRHVSYSTNIQSQYGAQGRYKMLS